MIAMRFLANENVPGDAVLSLRKQGHDVLWIRTEQPGLDDESVLEIAQAEKRILLTFDKDFGSLAFQKGAKAIEGIILFRIPKKSPSYISTFVLSVLESRNDWSGHFAVVEENRIRMRPIKS